MQAEYSPGVHESHVTRLGTGNDTSLGDQSVGKGRLSVVDVSDNRHVSDVGRSVHETSDLADGEARGQYVIHAMCGVGGRQEDFGSGSSRDGVAGWRKIVFPSALERLSP
jgi:hypothetical protein